RPFVVLLDKPSVNRFQFGAEIGIAEERGFPGVEVALVQANDCPLEGVACRRARRARFFLLFPPTSYLLHLRCEFLFRMRLALFGNATTQNRTPVALRHVALTAITRATGRN